MSRACFSQHFFETFGCYTLVFSFYVVLSALLLRQEGQKDAADCFSAYLLVANGALLCSSAGLTVLKSLTTSPPKTGR